MVNRYSSLCAALLLLSAGTSVAADAPPVLAAWSQITGETDPTKAASLTAPGAEFRFIIAQGGDCGAFSVAFDTASMQNQPASSAPTTRSGDALAIAVCSLTMGADWVQAHLLYQGQPATLSSQINAGSYVKDGIFYADRHHKTVAPWTAGPSNGQAVSVKGPASIGQDGELTLVSLGDTGCRGIPDPKKPTSRHNQACESSDGSDPWPLAWLAGASANLQPDLVIHVGDYRYFFEKNDYTSWPFWQKDFFPAAQPLLLAAPWVFTRGNHEGCPGADLPYGAGYFQLFGSNAGESCGAVQSSGSPPARQYMMPWYFDVATGGLGSGEPHRFVMIDVNTQFATADITQATTDFETGMTITAAGPASNWWVMHTPGVQAVYYGGAVNNGDTGVRQALEAATELQFCGTPAAPTPCRPSQFLMGHQHLFQTLTFADTDGGWLFPRMVIVGNSGTKIDQASPSPGGQGGCAYTFPNVKITGASSDLEAAVFTESQHGLVVWTRTNSPADPSGWTPEYLWAGNTTLQPWQPVPPIAKLPACLGQ